VLSLLISLVGALALLRLPVAQYPRITPPTVQITASYPGASAEVLAQTVATPIEEQVNGAEGMLYMSSSSNSSGQLSVTVTFGIERDIDEATIDVQNRVAIAEPQLPSAVTRLGITIRKQSTELVMIVALRSPGGEFDPLFMSNYAAIHMLDALARVPGVGAVRVFGQGEYGVRVWLDPDRLAALELTSADVVNALSAQNLQAPAGQLGQPPSAPEQEFQYTVRVRGRLESVPEFEQVIVRARPDGSLLRLGDVARVELGAESYTSFSRLDGAPATMIGIYQLPTANALEVVEGVRAAVDELAQSFPAGMTQLVPLDTTRFVRESIAEVALTLGSAFALVFAVVYLFLQSARATLIPALAVPVSLIGSFAVFGPLGFSVNTLTLFGLVLAVGLVVDDAIVVVEAAQRHIEEEFVGAREAARRAMDEVSGPVVAIALVLAAVFVPVAFLGGITGQLYQQFALTLTASILISALVALTLSPALCALLLQPVLPQQRTPRGPRWLARGFAGFERGFARASAAYLRTADWAIRHRRLMLLALVLLVASSAALLRALPGAFVPTEDQGYFIAIAQLPDAASLARTARVARRVEGELRALPGVQHVVAVGGFSALGAASSSTATFFVVLQPWEERAAAELQLDALLAGARQRFAAIPEAQLQTFNPPPIPGLGSTGGFQLELQSRGGADPAALAALAERLLAAARERPEIGTVFTTFRASVPQLQLEVDRARTIALGVPLDSVFDALQTYLSGRYVNDVNWFGRTYRVTVQAAADHRSQRDDVSRFTVRNAAGEMIQLGALARWESSSGPEAIEHFNVYPALQLNGSAAPGYSSGQAMAALEELAAELLPAGYGYEWTGLSYQERASQGQAPVVLALAVLFVFLLLAALYESWSAPLAVLLSVPIAVAGALLATALRGLQNDVYAQIGLVMVIGLAARNAVLIVEFALRRRERGESAAAAALESARIRLRPIVMTSLAFTLGVLPLAIASGAGSAARNSLGTSVIGGMLAATLLGLLFVPALFVWISDLTARRSPPTP
jgi:hydrophobe/amphiphile efflux-1 (HAE1) family protein